MWFGKAMYYDLAASLQGMARIFLQEIHHEYPSVGFVMMTKASFCSPGAWMVLGGGPT